MLQLTCLSRHHFTHIHPNFSMAFLRDCIHKREGCNVTVDLTFDLWPLKAFRLFVEGQVDICFSSQCFAEMSWSNGQTTQKHNASAHSYCLCGDTSTVYGSQDSTVTQAALSNSNRETIMALNEKSGNHFKNLLNSCKYTKEKNTGMTTVQQ